MPALSFDVLLDKLLNGTKTLTIRVPRKRPLTKGDSLFMYWKQRSPNNKFLGMACVKGVKRVRLGSITEEEAVLDGFESKAELLAGFRSVHGAGVEERLFDVIKFEWC